MKKLLLITIFFIIFSLSFAQTTPTLLISPSINLPKGVKPALPPQVLSQIQQQEQLLLSQPAQDQQIPQSKISQPIVSESIRSIIEEILPDENRDDDDIVQINNLRITNFFPFGNDKGVILAVRDIGWKCMFFESEESKKSLPCPLGIRKSILGRELVILIKYNDTILLQRNRERAKLVEFQVGDKINVYGFMDKDNNGIDALIVRNLDLPRRNIGKPTVISPNGGEEWQLGSYQEIRWKGFNSKKVNIEIAYCTRNIFGIACPTSAPYVIAENIDNVGYFKWNVGKILRTYNEKLTIVEELYRIGIDSPLYYIIVRSTDGREYDESDNYFKIVTSQSKYLAPVILGFSGPTKLRVGEKGKWTIEAKDPQGGYLYYRIKWGDEPQYASVEEQATSELGVRYLSEQKFEVEHIYNEPGFYNVYVKVTNDYGLSTEAKLTVNVTR
jgi:hypothetical protein